MGRTVRTFRMILEQVIHDWQSFRRALRSADREAFDNLMLQARRHGGAASNAARLNPTEALFMAVLVEHEKELERLSADINKLKDHVKSDQDENDTEEQEC